MTVTAQIAANRLNALASSGPISTRSKARSSRNAEKHGFHRALIRLAWLQVQSTDGTVIDSPRLK